MLQFSQIQERLFTAAILEVENRQVNQIIHHETNHFPTFFLSNDSLFRITPDPPSNHSYPASKPN